MSRPSAESLAVAPVVDVARIRQEPRPDMPPDVAREFSRVVASVDASHFRVADALLEDYAQAIVIRRQLSAELAEQGPIVDGKPSPLIAAIREQSRLIASLATKLRLTPQSRISKDKAGKTTARPESVGVPLTEYVERARAAAGVRRDG